MALTLVNVTGFFRGVRVDESGINVSSFKSSIEPEWTETLPDRQNVVRGFAQAPQMLDLTVEGEFNTTLAGLMLVVLGTAATIANSSAFWGAPSTGKYFMKGSVDEDRSGWGKMSMELKSYSGVP